MPLKILLLQSERHFGGAKACNRVPYTRAATARVVQVPSECVGSGSGSWSMSASAPSPGDQALERHASLRGSTHLFEGVRNASVRHHDHDGLVRQLLLRRGQLCAPRRRICATQIVGDQPSEGQVGCTAELKAAAVERERPYGCMSSDGSFTPLPCKSGSRTFRDICCHLSVLMVLHRVFSWPQSCAAEWRVASCRLSRHRPSDAAAPICCPVLHHMHSCASMADKTASLSG